MNKLNEMKLDAIVKMINDTDELSYIVNMFLKNKSNDLYSHTIVGTYGDEKGNAFEVRIDRTHITKNWERI